MSYSITLRVYQTNPDRGSFRIVERSVWHYANGGTWSQSDSTFTLTMGGSGTSGVVRFLSDQNEYMTVTVGVHNYKRWCDVIVGLKPIDTATLINGQYYGGGRDWVREKQQAEASVTSAAGTNVQVKYTVAKGNNLEADVIIG